MPTRWLAGRQPSEQAALFLVVAVVVCWVVGRVVVFGGVVCWLVLGLLLCFAFSLSLSLACSL